MYGGDYREPKSKPSRKLEATATTTTAVNVVSVSAEEVESVLLNQIEKLSEKRRDLREEGIETLTHGLCMHYCLDFVMERASSLTDVCKKSLKFGSLREKVWACKLAAVMCVTLGSGESSLAILKELQALLVTIIGNPSSEPDLVAAAFEVLGIASFIAEEDDEQTAQLMELMSQYFSSKEGAEYTDAIESALSSWTLLSTVSKQNVYDLLAQSLSAIANHVTSSDLDLQITAAEAIAVLAGMLIREEPEEFDISLFESYVDSFDPILDHLASLSRTKKISKKDKKRVNVVNDILATLENKTEPKSKLKLRNQVFTWNTWQHAIQLAKFRNLLGKGFKIHFEKNELLHQVFDITFDETLEHSRMSKIEKRLYMSSQSAASKERTIARARQHDLLYQYTEWGADDE